MSFPIDKFLDAVRREHRDASATWPGNRHRLAALTEEVGEVAQAMLQHDQEGAGASAIYREAVQVAAMAMRLALEGDASFAYRGRS